MLFRSELWLALFEVGLQFQLLQEDGMAKLAGRIRATKQAIPNEQLDALPFPLLNTIPLINGLEEGERFTGRPFVRNPLLALLLPRAEKRGTPRIGIKPLDERLAIPANDAAGRLNFSLARKLLPTWLNPFGQRRR